MKTKIITIALITVASFTNQLVAQETANLKTRVKSNQANEKSSGNVTPIDDWQEPKVTAALKTRTKSNACNERTAGYDLKQNVKCRVVPTETGFTIAFDNVGRITGGVVARKRDNSAHSTGSYFSVSSADNSVSIVSPRDPASGLPTGKRMHKPMVITKELDKSSPPSGIEIDEPGVHKVASSGGGAGKASFSDLSVMSAGKATFKEFTVTKRCDGKITKISCPDGECEIPLDDCPNGTCDLVCEWSWGVSQQGSSMSSSGSAGFSLEIQDGACTAMAINEKGLPGEKKPNSTATNNPK